jgi:hypothetical protein
MALEAIQCEKCGSAEVTEFKRGSYVCGHCEAVFKEAPAPSSDSGGCQLDSCGVPAIGLCSNCGRRFCTTHQAVGSREDPMGVSTVRYSDFCTACLEERVQGSRDDLEAALAEAAAISDPVAQYLAGLMIYAPRAPDPYSDRARDPWSDKFASWAAPRVVAALPSTASVADDDSAIARFFLAHARGDGARELGLSRCEFVVKERREERHRVRATRTVRIAHPPVGAWRISWGATMNTSDFTDCNAFVLDDGRVFSEGKWRDMDSTAQFPAGNLNKRAHLVMAAYLSGQPNANSVQP